MEQLNAYIMPVVLIICLCVGFIIKNLIPGNLINKLIPLMVGLLGVLIAIWNADWAITPDVMATGLVSGLASTGTYEGARGIFEFINSVVKSKTTNNEKKNE